MTQTKIKARAHHRNGIGGAPFKVVTFICGETGRHMVMVSFDHEKYATAVLDIDLLAEDRIAFAENSWRGDNYQDSLNVWQPQETA